MSFVQAPPVLNNQYLDDRVLRSYLRRILPAATLAAIESDLTDLGEFAIAAWAQARSRDTAEPRLTHWNAWGERVDRIELTPAWQAAQPVAARYGLVAAGHESAHGTAARQPGLRERPAGRINLQWYTCSIVQASSTPARWR